MDLTKINFDELKSEQSLVQDDSPLRSTMSEAIKVNPDQQVKINDLSVRSGIPIEAVQDDPEEVDNHLKLKSIDFDSLSKNSPRTSEYLSDYKYAAIAHDDTPILQRIEDTITSTADDISQYGSDITESFNIGVDMVEYADIGTKRMWGALGYGEGATVEDLTKVNKFESLKDKPIGDYGLIGDILPVAAEQLPIWGEILKSGAIGALSLGAPAAGAGAVVAGPPGAVTTGLIGAKLGGRLGVAKAAFDLEAGSAFNEFAAMRDDMEQSIDPEIASYASIGVGAVNAMLETVSFMALGRTVTPAVRSLIRDRIKNIIKTEAGRDSMKQFAKSFLAAVGTEMTTEAIQEFTTIAGGEIAKLSDPEAFDEQTLGTAVDNLFSVKTAERMGESAIQAAQAAIVFGGTGSSISAVVHYNQQKKLAESEQLKIDALNEATSESKLKERDKDSFRQFMQKVGGESNVFIDGPQAVLYLKDKTPEEINADPALKLINDQVQESAVTGGDVVIKVADFGVDITGTEHFDALRPFMTMSQDTTAPFRQEQAEKEQIDFINELTTAAQENASQYVEAQDIFTTVRDQLIDTGRVSNEQAKVMATIVPAWATVQAVNRGVPVKQVYDESGLTIEGPMTGRRADIEAAGVKFGQPLSDLDELQQLVDRFSTSENATELAKEIAAPFTVEGDGVLAYTDERLDNISSEFSKSNGESKAYVGFINPLDFVKATTGSDEQLERIRQESGDLDVERLRSESQTPFFGVVDGEIDAHEGRHRMIALADAGFTKVPVIIKYDNYQTDDTRESITLRGQFGVGISGERGTDINVESPVLLNDNNKQDLRELFKADQPDVFFQKETKPSEPKLSALHNLSFENLIFADSIGGLAVPSIGVVKEDMGIEGYGEVTLIGTRDLADPEKMPVYDADAYTTTFPAPEYNKIPVKKADAMFAQFNESLIKYQGDNYLITELYDYATKHGDPKEILSKLGRSSGVRAMFLNELTGTKIRPVIRDVKLRHANISDHPEVVKFMKNLPSDYMNYGAFDEKAIAIRKDFAPVLERLIRNDYELKKEKAKNESVKKMIDESMESTLDDLIDEDGSASFGIFDRILQDQRRIGEKEIDSLETSKKIDARLKGKEIEFKSWLESKILPNFGDPYVRIGRTKESYTLDNIITKMTGEDVKAAEKTMTFSPGKARAAAAHKFSSIESMRQFAPEDLGSAVEIKDAREESEKVLEKYREELSEYYTNTDWRGEIDIWNAMDDSMKVLAEWATNRLAKGSEKAFKDALRKNDFKNVPRDVIQRGIAAGESLLSAPVPYYEAKPLRAVQLNEFVGAAVPNKTPKEIIDILKKNDIQVVKYGDRYDETARTNAVVKLRKKLSKTHDVLFQESRGYYDPQNTMIRLTESSDLSTFLHEFAHFMYDMELKSNGEMINPIHSWFKRNSVDIAKEADGYSEGVDVGAGDVLAFYNDGTSGDTTRDSAIERAGHEWFARGFETYLMEGKSPSTELAKVFRTIAQWLTKIYNAIKGDLKVNLDGEMKEVFDRLLATDEQIEAAKVREKFKPMFTNAAMAGMTEEEFAAYQKKQQGVTSKATEILRDKLIKEITRHTEQWWNNELTAEAQNELPSLEEEPVYNAINTLTTGEMKLDRATLKDMVGEVKTDKRGRESVRIPTVFNGMHAPGGEGVHPDVAAAFFGFNSGDEMVKAIAEAQPIQEAATQRAEEKMVAKYGDILKDGTIEKEADEALRNEERGSLILTELRALRRGTNGTALDRKVLMDMARENIGKLSFRDIHPEKYRKAEIRAAQEAATALATGDRATAAVAKARQALNFYLGKAATEAKNDIMKTVDGMARYRKKSTMEAIKSAGNDYWEQLVNILNRFELRKGASLKSVKQVNDSLQSWMEKRISEDGDGLVLTPAVLNESYVTHWKNVPYRELQGIRDSVKNIEHVARYSNKVKIGEEKVDFNKFVQEWVDHMDEVQDSQFKSQRTDVVDGRKWGRWAMAQMTKIPYLASWLDGGERTGMSHDALVQPFTDAYDNELKLWKEIGTPVLELLQNRSKEDLARHQKKIFIPEIQDDNNDGNLTGGQIIAVALNTGNEGNLKKMLLGEGWANPDLPEEISFNNNKLQAVLKHMTASDWQLVQNIWDQMELLYPQLAEVHRKTTGMTPPKVEATPIEVNGVTYVGGYYPVKYDPNRSQRAQENEDKLNAETESMFGSVGIQASVNASATNERTGYYAPIRLSLDVVPNHFQETIHYITHHDAVRQTNKLIRNTTVAKTIKEKVGPEEYAQLRPWLNDIAKDGREAPTKMYWDDMLQRLRFGATLGIMGFSASTGIVQILGLSNTVAEMGVANTMQAIRAILGSPNAMAEAWQFAVDNSKVMNHRMKTMDREIKNAMARIEGKRGLLAGVQEASMKHIALLQTYLVDLPTWHAGYIKGMKEFDGDEARAYKYADWAVENIQGSGATKDLARIMRGQSETGRMFTMFMTFFSALWNMERDLVKGAKSKTYSRTTIAAKLMFLFTIPVFLDMLMKGEFDGDDEDEETGLQKYMTQMALYPVASVPFIRDIAGGVIGPYGYNVSPIAQMLESGVKSAPELVIRPFTDEEITISQVKGTTKLVGAALGVPGVNQVWKTGEHLYNVTEEGEDLTIKEILYGPKK